MPFKSIGLANEMIDSVYGKLHSKSPDKAIVDVGGFRVNVQINIGTFERLPNTGEAVDLLIYFHVREDIMQLYGFTENQQRDVFKMLIGISGIGPRSAMGILSGVSINEFKQRIITGDVKSLTVIPGIGPKTAKRIIIELKEKFVIHGDKEDLGFSEESPFSVEMKIVIQALVSLGYKHNQAQQVLKKMEKENSLSGSVEDMIKKALSKM